MLDAVREPTLPASPSVSRRAFGLGLLQAGIALQCSNAFAKAAQATDEGTEETEQVEESESAQIRYLKKWMQSPEGRQMKTALEKAILQLEAPSFEDRQKAKGIIKESINALQAMIFPFPEELLQILGEGLFPSDRFGEDFRRHMCEHHGSTIRQARDFDAIQEMMRMKNRNGSPHIMPGEYSVEELKQALETQTGLRVRLAHSSPAVGMVVTKERNEWSSVLQEWAVELGKWGLDYSLFDDTIYLEEHPNPNKKLVTQGPDMFIHETFPATDNTNCTVMRVPTVGEFFQSDGSLGNTSHSVYIAGIGKEGTLEKWRWEYCKEPQKNPNYWAADGHSFPVLASSARRVITLPVGGEAKQLGRHQSLRTYVRPSDTGWIITIEIDFGDGKYTYSGIDRVKNVAWKNMYQFYDEDGDEVGPNTLWRDGDGVSGRNYCEFEVPRKPTHISINYIPDVQFHSLRLPQACLPKNTNP